MKSQKVILRRNLKNSKKIKNSNTYVAGTRKFLKSYNKSNKSNKSNKIKTQKGGIFRVLPNGDIISDQYLGLNYKFKEENGEEKHKYIEIRPFPLNAMFLQYLCNNECIHFNEKGELFITNKPGEENNFNLIATVSISSQKISKKLETKSTQKFIDIFEDETTTTTVNGNTLSILVKRTDSDSSKYVPPAKRVPFVLKDDITFANELLESINDTSKLFDNLKHKNFNINVDYNDQYGDFKIVGYPDPKHMNPLLSNEKFMSEYNTIAEYQKENYHKWLIGLYNKLEDDTNKISDLTEETELYKLFDSDIKFLNKYQGLVEYESNKEKREELIKGYQNNLNKTLKDDKPMLRPNFKIKYIFFIFIKGSDGKYKFLVYNIKDISSSHTGVLKKVLELIETEIPKKFNLLHPSDNNIHNNFYSFCEYGEIFKIETEYLHPMTRIETFSYRYAKSMQLEQLIYTSQIKIDDISLMKNVKLQYSVKNYNISDIKNNNSIMTGGTIFNIDFTGINIIMCNTLYSFNIEIYYKKDNKYYYLVLSPNLTQYNIKKISEKLSSGKKIHSYKDNSIQTILLNLGGSYKILKYKEFIEGNIEPVDKIFTDLKNKRFPVIRYKRHYSYPFIEKIPISLKKIFDEALELLKEKSENNNILSIDQKIHNTNIQKIIVIDDFICVCCSESNKKATSSINNNKKELNNNITTIWIFNKLLTQKRLINVGDLNNVSLLIKLSELLKKNRIYNFKTHKLFTHILSGYTLNLFHLKIFSRNYYQSSSSGMEISQTSELRLYDIETIINFMSKYRNYYKELLNQIPYYSRYLLQFIKPPEI